MFLLRCMIFLQAFFNLFSTPSLADLDGITDLLPMQTGRSPFGALLKRFWSILKPFWSTFGALFWLLLTVQLTV